MNEAVVLDGLNVLNTIGDGTTSKLTDIALLLVCAFAIGTVVTFLAWLIDEVHGAIPALAFVALLVTSGYGNHDVPAPIQYEVTLRDGTVIDATRWKIVEQRGEIYVIEEREAAE